MKKQIGQLFFIGLKGTTLSDAEAAFIVDNNIGGIILFARNCESPKQLAGLCQQIQGLRHKMPDKSPLFIGVDMEGGRVARLKPPFTQLFNTSEHPLRTWSYILSSKIGRAHV